MELKPEYVLSKGPESLVFELETHTNYVNITNAYTDGRYPIKTRLHREMAIDMWNRYTRMGYKRIK